MRNKPVEVVRVVGEVFNLKTGAYRGDMKPYFTAMWKTEKEDCGHRHTREKTARRCLPVMELFRRNALAIRRMARTYSLPRYK